MDIAQGERALLKGSYEDKEDYGVMTSSFGSKVSYDIEDDDDENDVRIEAREEDNLIMSAERSATHNVSLSWADISTSVTIPGKKTCFGESKPATTKTILDNVSGVVSPGSILAIMGPRGSGKSTLLNVLTSRNTEDFNVSGEIRLNGVATQGSIKNISAYVQQDDLFLSVITVREQLQFRALLRMDKRFNKQQRLTRVEEVIREVGLIPCSDSRIGTATGTEKGISGGERKRLSVACELLTNPPIFLCDEPTSGLDSFMAYEIIKTLQKMARRGRSVLCTIHQPSSEVFAMFSQVLLLSEGKTAFMGSIEKAMDFFKSMGYPCPERFNPADHFIITLSVAPGDEIRTRQRSNAICDGFRKSDAFKDQERHHEALERRGGTSEIDALLSDDSSQTRYRSSFVTQLTQLLWRAWAVQARDPLYTWMRLARIIILTLVIGLTYLQLDTDQKGVQDINGALFLILINISFAIQNPVLSTFPVEMDIVLRDNGSAVYGMTTYYLSKSFAELVVCSLDTLIFITLNYWIIGFQDTFEAYFFTCLAAILFSWCAVATGYSISVVCRRIPIALAVNTPISLLLMLFGGFFLNDSSAPDYMIWIREVSMYKYGYQIVMAYQWKDVDHIECDARGNSTITGASKDCPFSSGQEVLDYQKIDDGDIAKNFVILGSIFTGLYLFTLVGLLLRGRKAKN